MLPCMKTNQIACLSIPIHHGLQALTSLVPVCVRLVGSLPLDTNVVRLLLRQCCELCTKSRQVEPGHFLIQLFGQEVHVILVLLLCHILEKIELCKRLVGERTGHDK
eukprot:gnl/MRDRNA2_/MRDRNA2_86823_c0_seq7.p1 gnl/MRDRNA2_/MRDRNA2_86823_c0~~gnl/MRDRNA2_/MRDRNA2_86823_c0_seq7.p1  ORF type:complete len:107 (+),score=6.80 gnl/MRDRNA2_/MRDRNA2_86823_c0_seq7:247-567(+)